MAIATLPTSVVPGYDAGLDSEITGEKHHGIYSFGAALSAAIVRRRGGPGKYCPGPAECHRGRSRGARISVHRCTGRGQDVDGADSREIAQLPAIDGGRSV